MSKSKESPISNTTSNPASAELSNFSTNSFNVDQYLKNAVAKVSVEATKDFYKQLLDSKGQASDNLRTHVYENYKEFMVISREISKLENNMTAAQSLLVELRNINTILKENSTLDPLMASNAQVNDRRRKSIVGANGKDAHSTADSEIIAPTGTDTNEMLDKSASPENSFGALSEQPSKLLDAALEKWLGVNPKRKLLRDGSYSSMLTESSALTPKIKQLVEMYLYDDGLVVVLKKKSMLSKSKRTIIHAWALSEIAISTNMSLLNLGLATSLAPQTADCSFLLSHFSDQYIYRCESVDEKQALINAIREAVVLVKRRLLDADKSRADKSLIWGQKAGLESAAQASSTAQDLLLRPINGFAKESSAKADFAQTRQGKQTPGTDFDMPFAGKKIEEELSTADLKWLRDVSEELDVYIAHRDWDEAVELLVKAKMLLSQCTYLTPSTAAIRQRIKEGLETLTGLICGDLSGQKITRLRTQRAIGWLLRLDLPVYAHNVFLTTRSQAIQQRIWKISFTGDLQHYVVSLCIVFPLIKSTTEWYRSSFGQLLALNAGFVQWVIDEVDQMLERFQRQLFQSTVNFTTMTECIQSVVDASLILSNVGLDIHSSLEQTLFEHVASFIVESSSRLSAQIELAVHKDKWILLSSGVDRDPVEQTIVEEREKLLGPEFKTNVTESLLFFYKSLIGFLNELSLIMNMSLYDPIIESTQQLFLHYLQATMSAKAASNLSMRQQIAILLDLNVVVDQFLPKIQTQLQERFAGKPIPKLDQLVLYASDLVGQAECDISESFAQKFFKSDTSASGYDFANRDYSKHGMISDNAVPSADMQSAILVVSELLSKCNGYLSVPKTALAVISAILRRMDSELSEMSSTRLFGSIGIQQFALDMQFFLRVVEEFLDEATAEKANKLLEKALFKYLDQNKDSKTPLQDTQWLEERVDHALSSLDSRFVNFAK